MNILLNYITHVQINLKPNELNTNSRSAKISAKFYF